jgi:hypothetical protein
MCYSRFKVEDHNLIFNDKMKNLQRITTQGMRVTTQCEDTNNINYNFNIFS